MSFDAILTICVAVGAFALLARDRFAPEGILMGALVCLLVGGVLTPEAAFAGFANPAVIALGALYILTGALRVTGALDGAFHSLLSKETTTSGARVRLTTVTTALSAFLNNTPIVAMFMPLASRWAQRRQTSVSGLLLPLSYAAIFGGTWTLLGTATHLVVHGLLVERGMPGLGVFEMLPIGIAITVVGLPLSWLLARRLLDQGENQSEGGQSKAREYITDLVVRADWPLIGKSVEDAGLRHLPGLFLIRIERAGAVIAPVGPGEILFEGDRLSFAGVVETIVDLQRERGLEPAETRSEWGDWLLHEAVISRGSPLVGASIREANFRGQFNAAVVAVHRHGERIDRKIGDIVMRHGDTLLLQAAEGFARSFRDAADFYLISEVSDASRPRHSKAPIALLIMVGVIVTAALGVLPLSSAALAGAILSVALGTLTVGQARRAIDPSVLVVIAAALGLAKAFETTGVASAMAGILEGLSTGLGPVGLLAAVYVCGMILTEMVTNTAAAAILFPVAIAVAQGAGLEVRPFVLATSISAAVSLATPLGYQTNMMVYGPGGYRFSDFVKMGLPLQVVCGTIAVAVISWMYELGLS